MRWVLLPLFVLVFGQTLLAVDISPVDYSNAIDKLSQSIRGEVEQKSIPAFSIAIVDQNRIIWSAGFGHQDSDKKLPATAQTVYRVGSISKLFTAIRVMQLVEQGKLNLDEPVQTYLPKFQPRNEFGRPITIRHLLSHRSGLVRESPVGSYFDASEPSLAETVASLNRTSLVYAPNTRTKYSNAAVAVLGAIAERQLKSSHPEQVRQAVLDPLNMHSTGFVTSPEFQSAKATGWMRTLDGRRFVAPDFLLGTGPAGNLYSSVEDLSRLLMTLFAEGRTASGSILKPETLTQMLTPTADEAGKPTDYGLGFHVKRLDGHQKVGHGGAVYGFSTQLAALPEKKLGVIGVAALDGSNGVVERLTDYALRLMLAAQDKQPLPDYATTIPIPPDRARILVGEYRSDENDMARIVELAGTVYLYRGTFRHELRASSQDGSIVTDDVVGYGTRVEVKESSLIIEGKTYQRLHDQPPVECPERLKGLIGEYGPDHNVLYILEDQGQLYCLIEWFYYYPLQQISDTEFRFPDYGLYHGEGLKFERDDSGRVKSVVAAEVRFDRRSVGTAEGETFRITPLRPVDDRLFAESLAAMPPQEAGEFRETDLVELLDLDPTLKLDIRYATTNNFTGAVFYKQPRAFLQRPAAEAVARVHRRLSERGLGLLIHDGYRPWYVTRMFYETTPDAMKNFVANPARGSRHNRGCAIDLSLYDLKSGEPISMVSGYDEFSPRAFPLYPGGTSRQRWHRELLRSLMESEGFDVFEFEWWHFDFTDWKKYRIGNVTFEQLQ